MDRERKTTLVRVAVETTDRSRDVMEKVKRLRGRKLRQIARLQKQWVKEGRKEGKTENELAWRMGQGYRMGIRGAEIDRVRDRVS